jgi:hypothetical protein
MKGVRQATVCKIRRVDKGAGMSEKSKARKMARLLRLAMVKQQLQQGNITREQAVKVLSGPLSPGKDETVIDDSRLLNLDYEMVALAMALKEDEE